jgi:2-aminoadipate transaminase
MDQYFPKEIKHTNPYGGLFAWVKLKDGLNSKEILEEALKEKVAYVPGSSFFPNGGRDNHFRLNYSCMPEEKIVEGIKRLGKVLYKYY